MMMKNKLFFKTSLILVIFFALKLNFVFCNNTKEQNFFHKDLSLTSTNTWLEFNLYNQNLKLEKCAWVGLLTFKSKNAIQLKQINFKWSGNFLKTKNLSASLYQKKESNEDQLIPIEDNLVCDGIWNEKTQQLIFKPDEKLVAINKYYLVINFSEDMEDKLKSGAFVLTKNNSLKILNKK